MADLTKTIQLIFGVSDDTAAGLGSVTGRLSALDDSIQGIAAPFANVADSATDATAKIGLFTAGVIAAAATVAGGFTSSILTLGSLVNATADDIEFLSTNLLEFGRNSTASFTEIQEGARIALSTGTDLEDLVKILAQAEELAVSGSASLSSSVSILARSLNAYGQGAESAAEFTEAIFTASQLGDTSLEELAASMGKVASTAKASGVDFDSLSAAIVGLTIAGVNTAQTTTKLSSLFKELAAPSKELIAALGGISLESDGLFRVMQQLNSVVGGSQGEMDKLFSSSEAVSAALILSTDSSGAFNKALIEMDNNTGKVRQNFDLFSGDATKNMTNLVNNIQATLVQIGIPFLDDFGRTVGGLNAVLAGIGDGVQAPNFQQIYGSFDDFSVRLAKFLGDVGTALPEALGLLNFDGLVESVRELGEEFGVVFDLLLGGDLDLTNPKQLAEALQKAVDITETLVIVTKSILEQFRPFFDFLGKATSSTVNLNKETKESIGVFLGSAKAVVELGTALGLLLISINQTGGSIGGVLSTIGSSFSIVMNTIELFFREFALEIVRKAQLITTALSNIVPGDLGDKFESSAKSLSEIATNLEKDIVENTGKINTAFTDFGIDAFESVDKVNDSVKELDDSTKNLPVNTDKAAKSFVDMGDSTAVVVKDVTQISAQLGEISKVDQPVAIEKLGEDAKVAKQETAGVNLELAKLTQKAHVANLNLETEQIKSELAVVDSSLDSLTSNINSTGDALSVLFSKLGTGSFFDDSKIRASIDNETRIRTQAAEQQKDLIQAQIDLTEARTQSLNNGLSEITITADGLEPEIEAFMFAILDRIKLRATEDMANFLIGLP